jgi:hypothetical protein
MNCPKCKVFCTFGKLSFSDKSIYYACGECGFGSWKLTDWMSKK